MTDQTRHPVSDVGVLATCVLVVVGVWCRWVVPVGLGAALAVVGAVVALRRSPRWRVLAVIGLALVASARSAASWSAVAAAPLGPYAGPATLVTDPDPVRGAVRVVLDAGGHRYEVWARGMNAARLRQRLAGEVVVAVGERRPAPPDQARRLAVRHIGGQLDLVTVAGADPGGPAARAANRLHRRVIDAVSHWPADEAALFRGLVVGNDREVSDSLVQAFRRSGLAHLTAVSGQNVAYVLAVVAVLSAHLRSATRWAVAIGVMTWFALLTRFEPSVLRASFMAGLSLTAATVGGDRRPTRLLPMAVTLLVLLDPLLVWSISFWLSVSATSGLVWITPAVLRWLPGPRSIAVPVAVTTGAQLGVLPVSAAVFGLPSSISLVTNLAAVPVASGVMLVGLPLSMTSALLPDSLVAALMWPVHLGVRWVAAIARIGDALAPPRVFDWVAWLSVSLVAGMAALRRQQGR